MVSYCVHFHPCELHTNPSFSPQKHLESLGPEPEISPNAAGFHPSSQGKTVISTKMTGI